MSGFAIRTFLAYQTPFELAPARRTPDAILCRRSPRSRQPPRPVCQKCLNSELRHPGQRNQCGSSGYVINAKYTLGRNKGNTFQQTYKDTMVQGVPIAGPFVGVTFPPEDYVALPIGHHQLYITWLDPSSFAIVDVFVMNFVTHTVYDYAPGSDKPESAGTITVVKRGPTRIP